MAKEYNETTNKLTNKDLKKLGLRSMFYQTGFTFEKMQGNSFGWSILPGLEKIHGKDSEEVSKALDEYGVDFINTEQHAASFLMGLVLSMEENRADRKLIKNMKTGLFGSFAGIGDAIFWFTLLPISGSIAASLCKQHSILGPIFFLAFWILMAVSRVFFLKAGYKLGSESIFDSVIPNLLPPLFVGILYYIFKKKKVSIVVLILAIIAFAILMSLLGWL